MTWKDRILSWAVLLLLILIAPTSGMCDLNGYLSLFADSTRTHTAYCSFEGNKALVRLWVVGYPRISQGLLGAEFQISYPENIIQLNTIQNTSVIEQIQGDLGSGIRVIYSDCQRQPHWLFSQNLFVNDHEFSIVELNSYHMSSCEPSHGEAQTYWNLYLNYSDDLDMLPRECIPPILTITPISSNSWGSIKALYKK